MILAVALALSSPAACTPFYSPEYRVSDACAARWLLENAEANWLERSAAYYNIDEAPAGAAYDRYRVAVVKYIDCLEAGASRTGRRDVTSTLVGATVERCAPEKAITMAAIAATPGLSSYTVFEVPIDAALWAPLYELMRAKQTAEQLNPG